LQRKSLILLGLSARDGKGSARRVPLGDLCRHKGAYCIQRYRAPPSLTSMLPAVASFLRLVRGPGGRYLLGHPGDGVPPSPRGIPRWSTSSRSPRSGSAWRYSPPSSPTTSSLDRSGGDLRRRGRGGRRRRHGAHLPAQAALRGRTLHHLNGGHLCGHVGDGIQQDRVREGHPRRLLRQRPGDGHRPGSAVRSVHLQDRRLHRRNGRGPGVPALHQPLADPRLWPSDCRHPHEVGYSRAVWIGRSGRGAKRCSPPI
jgi:hypothetical protein